MGGAQTTASEASRPSVCPRRSRGSRGWPPGGDCKAHPCVRIFCILKAKYVYLQALCGLNLQKYMIRGLQGAAKFCELSIHKFRTFWSKLTELYDLGVARGQHPLA